MSIERMELVNVAGLMKDLNAVLSRCCQSECFHIEQSSHDMDEGIGFVPLSESNPYINSLKRLCSLAVSASYKPERADYSELKLENAEDFEDVIKELEDAFDVHRTRIRQLSESVVLREQALIQLRHLQGLNVDFEDIFSCKHIAVRFGKLPADSYPKLSYYRDKTFVFVSYDKDKDYYWGVYFAPYLDRELIDNIFESLFFERIRIPDFVKGTASNAFEEISEVLKQHQEELAQERQALDKLLSEKKELINSAYSKLRYLYDTFELRKNVSFLHDKFYLVGFIPKKDSKHFSRIFDDMEDVSILINPPEMDTRLEPPIKLKNGAFSRPFSTFVEMYGLPSYNGFNPTTLVAVTYTLLFGIMFGDLGQGLVIALIGLIMYLKKKNAFGQIMMRVGCSSAFFGLIYGSVFGFEELLDPLYHKLGLAEKPLDVFGKTSTVLIGAIAIGVTLIIVSILINIFISIKNRDYERGIFGHNGIAGLVFYVAVLAGLVSSVALNHNLFSPAYVICFIVLPLLVLFFRQPLSKLAHSRHSDEEESGGIGEFIAENFFELFEYLLSYISNTMSFLRVGGFVLSHAGMMLVVMTLAEGASAGAAPIIVIIGNIFVMGMEGLIVGIQVLRLEFYEIFSRFYDGDGHAFVPVKVHYESEVE